MNQLTEQQLCVIVVALRRLQDDMRGHRTELIVDQFDDYDLQPPPLEAIDEICNVVNEAICCG